MAQHSMAPGAGCYVGLWQPPGLIFHQASHHHLWLHRSSPNTGAVQTNLSLFAVHTLGEWVGWGGGVGGGVGEEGRKSMRGVRNNSAAAVAHPLLQCTHKRTHTITRVCSFSPTQHSDNDPHKATQALAYFSSRASAQYQYWAQTHCREPLILSVAWFFMCG